MNDWKNKPKICKCGARYLSEEEWTVLPFSFLSFDGRVTHEARLCQGKLSDGSICTSCIQITVGAGNTVNARRDVLNLGGIKFVVGQSGESVSSIKRVM